MKVLFNKIDVCFNLLFWRSFLCLLGLNRAPICAVNDEGYLIDKSYKNNFPPNNFTDAVLRNAGKKKEKLLPPLGRFQPFGIGKRYFKFLIIWISINMFFKLKLMTLINGEMN